MALTKIQKQKILEELKEKVARQKAIVFASITGLKVKDLSALRKKLKGQGCEIKVVKKTLIALALKEKKLEADLRKLEGEIALGFGYEDELIPFKSLYEFSKENDKLKIVGGLIGKEFLEKEKAIELAKLPSREELLTKLVLSLSSPISGLINVLEGNLKGLICVLSQLQKVKS